MIRYLEAGKRGLTDTHHHLPILTTPASSNDDDGNLITPCDSSTQLMTMKKGWIFSQRHFERGDATSKEYLFNLGLKKAFSLDDFREGRKIYAFRRHLSRRVMLIRYFVG